MNTGILVVLVAAALIIAWIVAGPAMRARRRRRHRRLQLDEADRMYLRRRVPLYRRMPGPERQRLDGLVRVFLEEKEFVGCQGLQVTRHMRLAVAAQACLLVLGAMSTSTTRSARSWSTRASSWCPNSGTTRMAWSPRRSESCPARPGT